MISKKQIVSLASVLPDKKLLSTDLEKHISKNGKHISMPPGIL